MRLLFSTLMAVCSFLLLNTIQAQQITGFRLDGTVHGSSYKGMVYLTYIAFDSLLIKDSTAIAADSSFHFTGKIKGPVLASLRLATPSTTDNFYLDTGKMVARIVPGIYEQNGMAYNDANLEYVTGFTTQALKKKFSDFWKELSASDISDLEKSEKLYIEMLSFVKEHPDNPLSATLLSQATLFSYQQAKMIYDCLSPDLQKPSPYNAASNLLTRLRTTAPGSKFHFIEMPDVAGQLVSNAQLKYKYLFIDCWASWCGPCRRENPVLTSLYQQYHDKGLEILGVSFDKEKSDWLQAIEKDGLTWPQVSELAEWKNSFARYYGIDAIPFNILVDQKGKIIAKGLNVKELSEKLEVLLAKE